MMFSSTSALYQDQFPFLEKQIDPQINITAQPFVQTPVTLTGQTEEPSPFKAVFT